MNAALTIPNSTIAALQSVEADAKVARPHAHFALPVQVIGDPDLGKAAKLLVLETLEQDARQLATASEEGMAGGESTQLRDVLVAKETLSLPPAELALAVALEVLKARLPEAAGTAIDGLLIGAIDALEALTAALAARAETPKRRSAEALALKIPSSLIFHAKAKLGRFLPLGIFSRIGGVNPADFLYPTIFQPKNYINRNYRERNAFI